MKMRISTIYGSGNWDEQFRQTVEFVPGETENRVINLYPEASYQTFEGFGGAITEAAGYVYSLMSEAQRRELTETYFSPAGMNYSLVRIPIDSCDFSLGQYTGFERPARYILPLLRDAQRAHGGTLSVMLSPWSPPVEWKTNDTREQGGKLRREHYGDYAEYLCRYILWYREQGFAVRRISLQNEPHAVQTWDSCVWEAAEQKVFLRDHMWPAMEKHGLTDIEIYLWDHNKERAYEWLREILDADTDKMIAGTCVHWYSGDHFEALDLCRERYPTKKLMVSESCFEYRVYGTIDPRFSALKFSREIIGDLNHGLSAFCDWNLLLDERGGPCYVDNFCLAPFLYDTKEKKLKKQLFARYLEQLSRHIVPSSVRIASTRYTDEIDVTAWRRPDGKLAVILLNNCGENRPVCVRLSGKEAELLLWPSSITAAVVETE